MKPYVIITFAAMDITWGQVLENLKNPPVTQYLGDPEICDDIQESFTFKSLESVAEFLTEAPKHLLDSLATSTGDDSFFDYTGSFLEQYQQLINGLISLTETFNPEQYRGNQDINSYYLTKIQIPRLLRLNIELFNSVILPHQSTEDSDEEAHNLWYSWDLSPIEMPQCLLNL